MGIFGPVTPLIPSGQYLTPSRALFFGGGSKFPKFGEENWSGGQNLDIRIRRFQYCI